MAIRTVLFDLFHTLVDVASAPGASGRHTADILGISRDEWRKACFSDHHEICRPTDPTDVVRTIAHSIDPAIAESRIVAAAQERRRRFDHALLNVSSSIMAVLNTLRREGLGLALVSNASTGEVSAWRASPLASVFDTAAFSCECGYRKPDPRIYRAALAALDARPEEAIFVGDGGSREHEGAREVGLKTVLTTRFIAGLDERSLEERRTFADFEIDDLSRLVTILKAG